MILKFKCKIKQGGNMEGLLWSRIKGENTVTYNIKIN